MTLHKFKTSMAHDPMFSGSEGHSIQAFVFVFLVEWFDFMSCLLPYPSFATALLGPASQTKKQQAEDLESSGLADLIPSTRRVLSNPLSKPKPCQESPAMAFFQALLRFFFRRKADGTLQKKRSQLAIQVGATWVPLELNSALSS